MWRSHSDINPDGFAIYLTMRYTFGAICALRHEKEDLYHIAFAKQIYRNRQYVDYIAFCVSKIYHLKFNLFFWLYNLTTVNPKNRIDRLFSFCL